MTPWLAKDLVGMPTVMPSECRFDLTLRFAVAFAIGASRKWTKVQDFREFPAELCEKKGRCAGNRRLSEIDSPMPWCRHYWGTSTLTKTLQAVQLEGMLKLRQFREALDSSKTMLGQIPTSSTWVPSWAKLSFVAGMPCRTSSSACRCCDVPLSSTTLAQCLLYQQHMIRASV